MNCWFLNNLMKMFATMWSGWLAIRMTRVRIVGVILQCTLRDYFCGRFDLKRLFSSAEHKRKMLLVSQKTLTGKRSCKVYSLIIYLVLPKASSAVAHAFLFLIRKQIRISEPYSASFKERFHLNVNCSRFC